MSSAVLDGVKVLDFTWSGAGPIVMRYLADFGATVVKIESKSRLDIVRRAGPFPDGKPDPDKGGIFCSWNCGKYGMTLDLNKPGGLAVARKLIAWADVVGECFTPGVIAKWGLDYESVRQINPDIIYLSSSGQGHTGPRAQQRAMGWGLAAVGGFTELAGWPDRVPSGVYTAYTDVIAPKFAAASLLAALDYRRRTGTGCYIDYSQLEGGLQFLAPLLLDYSTSSNIATRNGNRCDYAAPHGVYPCKGHERWIAIAAFTETEWKALCAEMGYPGLTEDPRFSTLLARKSQEDELDTIIVEWTRQHVAEELMKRLQGVGVPAGVVQTYEDLFNDPQLKHRGQHVYLQHSAIGRHAYETVAFKLSDTPGSPRFAAPCLGEHNHYVLRELLGLADEEITDLVVEGALE